MTLAAYRQSLMDHVDGSPNAAQLVLIGRPVMLPAHLQRLDREAFQDGSAV